MRLRIYVVASLLLFSGALCGARAEADATGPAFSSVPELASGFHSLYLQNFTEAREKFASWESQNPGEPFGEVAVAASYLFEELYRQGALSSDFFLNEKKFLNGIEGKPDPARMKSFQEAIQHARKLARQRLEIDARDPEGLFALALSAGMESDADMILKKQHIEALKRLKEANQDAQQLLAVRPEANDAYVALGVANYIIGSLSGGTRFMLRFGGIHGDKPFGAEAAPRIERGISGKPPVRRRICKSDGPAHSRAGASLSLFACLPPSRRRLSKKSSAISLMD